MGNSRVIIQHTPEIRHFRVELTNFRGNPNGYILGGPSSKNNATLSINWKVFRGYQKCILK